MVELAMLGIATLLVKTLWVGLARDSFSSQEPYVYKCDFTDKTCPTLNLPTALNSKPVQQ
ncbi:MAG: hypothetical protein H0U45_13740 [Tatlockia sp.]|nr:hypothetical protein [Tatlockia sp.]